MAKTYLGIEIGSSVLKIAVCEDEIVKKLILEDVPQNIINHRQIENWDGMAEVLKDCLKKYGISAKGAAIVLPEELTYVRRIVLPYMTIEQLKFNLPFEFRDFIMGDKDDYVYDYAVIDIREEEEEGKTTKKLDLIVAAVSRELLEKCEKMLKKCGLKFMDAAPESLAYQNIVRKYMNLHPDNENGEFAILNLGNHAVDLRIYTDGVYETGKESKPGLEEVFLILRDQFGIQNFGSSDPQTIDEALRSQACMDVYQRICLEVMRVFSFFQYNHPGNQLKTLYCCGVGVQMKPLMETIERLIGMEIKDLSTLFQDISEDENALTYGAATVGITWNEEA